MRFHTSNIFKLLFLWAFLPVGIFPREHFSGGLPSSGHRGVQCGVCSVWCALCSVDLTHSAVCNASNGTHCTVCSVWCEVWRVMRCGVWWGVACDEVWRVMRCGVW